MYCPKKFNSHTLDYQGIPDKVGNQCETTKCAWWNERFGMCCIAVESYLKGVADSRKEARIERMNKRGY